MVMSHNVIFKRRPEPEKNTYSAANCTPAEQWSLGSKCGKFQEECIWQIAPFL
jgi:hypothetical protein